MVSVVLLSLALAVARPPVTPAVGPGVRTTLPPAPVELYRVAWQRPLVPPAALDPKPQEHGGVAVDPQRRLAFVGTRDGWLHALRPDGTVLWEVQTGGAVGPPLVEGDTLYAGSSD